jgi:DNA-binding Xre family transcriptional regulator
MNQIRKSTRKLSAAQIKALQSQAKLIDKQEATTIKAAGKEAFAEHEQLLSIIAALKAERERQHITLAELAEQTGIAKPNLSRLENSTRTQPRLDTLCRYAQALGKFVKVELVYA